MSECKVDQSLTEETRTRLIGEIATVLRAGTAPPEAHAAALTLIGWLARRMPQDNRVPSRA